VLVLSTQKIRRGSAGSSAMRHSHPVLSTIASTALESCDGRGDDAIAGVRPPDL